MRYLQLLKVLSSQSTAKKNIDNAYLFLNYIFKPEMMAKTVDQFPLYPSIPEALDYTADFSSCIHRDDV